MDSKIKPCSGHGKRVEINKLLIKKIEKLAEIGLRNNEIAAYLEMPMSTFYLKCKEYPKIRNAIDRGRSRSVGSVSERLKELAMSGNIRAIEVYLSNARKYLQVSYSSETSDILKDKSKSAEEKMEAILKDHVDGYVPLFVVSEMAKVMETLYVAKGVEEAKKKLKRVIDG